jgi:hypothetical protein
MQLANGGVFVAEPPMVEGRPQCPECGATMVELDRLSEDGAVFIWYACAREECTGQSMSKKALRMGSVR